MKVVWLCHFSNSEMAAYFNKPKVKEMAPWISNLIALFKNQPAIELHIVAPNVYTNKNHNVLIDGVHYHFYKFIPILVYSKLLKNIYALTKIDLLTNFIFIKNRINRIVKNINPDIVHLHGAENAYYSAGFLDLSDRFLNLVTIQGFIRNSSAKSHTIRKSIEIEEQILKKTHHIGIRTKEMSEIALSLNPFAQLHFHNYPLTIPQYIKNDQTKSEFDIIFFARISKDKGIEDLLKAVALVKHIKPAVSLHIIGSAGKSYLIELRTLCKKLGIEDNVKFLGFMETQQDIFKIAVQAKMCVLPTYHDIIPGTIIESMYLKIPVIAYAVGGIPELNYDGENILLVERLNTEQLAEKIIYLLQNEKERAELAERAYLYIVKKYNNSDVIPDIMSAYKNIIQN